MIKIILGLLLMGSALFAQDAGLLKEKIKEDQQAVSQARAQWKKSPKGSAERQALRKNWKAAQARLKEDRLKLRQARSKAKKEKK